MHFTDRFKTPGSRRGSLNFPFPNRLNNDQILELESPISNEDIRTAVWGCGVDKSLGPDGFTFEFFRKYWTVVGPDFCIAVKWFFDHGDFAIGCNSSFVALIPKVLDPKVVKRFCLRKLYLDRLPTRSNLSRRNVLLPSLACPLCDHVLEDSSHLFFGCSVAKDIQKLICRWWNLDVHPYESYEDWLSWFKSIHLGSKTKEVERVFTFLGGAFGTSGTNSFLRLLFPERMLFSTILFYALFIGV
ncbi:RNA-directed DNA polymerase, eukaryota [Tanacetum coccineum]